MFNSRIGVFALREGRREEIVVQALPHTACARAVTEEMKGLFK